MRPRTTREAMEAAGYRTRADLARLASELHVKSLSTVYALRAGRTRPHWTQAQRLAALLSCDVRVFLIRPEGESLPGRVSRRAVVATPPATPRKRRSEATP
jgi:DNA-binding XRE family transcriptional regulator